ncbi:MAG: DUF2157 domain-containing protein [Helicobacteraceae bacterium]|jgi:uncharacterized membrane protein|nr:DUF2157 domain-containing protein [Helicobacteraceae bacterium]
MKKHLEWLENELPHWVAGDLISEDQAAKIRARYPAEQKRGDMASTILTGFGAVMVALGIIAVFAYNWHELSRAAKGFVAFAILLAAQYLAFFARVKKPDDRALNEGAGAFLPIAFAASFGIVAQTYNLGGDLVRFAMICIGFTLPVLFLTSSKTASAVFLFAITLVVIALTPQVVDPYFDRAQRDYSAELFVAYIFFAIWLVWYVRLFLADRHSPTTRLFNTLLMLSLICIGNSFAYLIWRGIDSAFLFNATLFATFWIVHVLFYPAEKRPQFKTVEEIAKASIAIMLLSFALYSPHTRYELPSFYMFFIAPYLILLGFSYKKLIRERLYELIVPIAPLIFLFYCAAQIPIGAEAIFTLVCAVSSLAFIVGGAKQLNLTLANQGGAWLAILILIKFFQTNLSFLTKGVGFIIIGAGFIAFSKFIRGWVRRSDA